ncbi:hypothetical protein P7C70_g2992, partial [Phenoliferia sp. Uapishka_3]
MDLSQEVEFPEATPAEMAALLPLIAETKVADVMSPLVPPHPLSPTPFLATDSPLPSTSDPSDPSDPPPPPPLRSRPPALPPALPQAAQPQPSPPSPRLTRAKANPSSAQAKRSFKEGSSDDEDEGDDQGDDPDASGGEDDEGKGKGSGGEKKSWAKATKTRWTAAEDAELVRLVRIKPALTWTEIGDQMPGRKSSGCMMRWYNFIREEGVAAPGDAERGEATGDGVEGEGAEGGTPATREREKKARGGATGSGEGKAKKIKSADGSLSAVLAMDPTLGNLPINVPSWASPIPDSLPVDPNDPLNLANPKNASVVRGRRTYSPGQLEGQLKTPSGKPMKVHSCPAEGCDAAFKRSEHLKRHYRSVHLGAKPFDCEDDKCSKSFSRKDNLRQHMKMVHNVDSPPWHRYVAPGAGKNNPAAAQNAQNAASTSTPPHNHNQQSHDDALVGLQSILDAANSSQVANNNNNADHGGDSRVDPSLLANGGLGDLFGPGQNQGLGGQGMMGDADAPGENVEGDIAAFLGVVQGTSNGLGGVGNIKRAREDEEEERRQNEEMVKRARVNVGRGVGGQEHVDDLIVGPSQPMMGLGMGMGDLDEDEDVGVVGLAELGGGMVVN